MAWRKNAQAKMKKNNPDPSTSQEPSAAQAPASAAAPAPSAPKLDLTALTAAIDAVVVARINEMVVNMATTHAEKFSKSVDEIKDGLKQIGRFIPPNTLAVALKAPDVDDDVMLIDDRDMVLSFDVRLDGPGGTSIARVRSSVALPEILAAESLPPCLETLESVMLQSIVGPTKAKLGRFVSELVGRRAKANPSLAGSSGPVNYGPSLPSEIAPLSESDLSSQAFQVYKPPAGGENPPPPLSEEEAMEDRYRPDDEL